MNITIKQILKNSLSTLKVLIDTTKQIDYKKLNNYIINMSQVDSILCIMEEASYCLKEILDYRLFAVAIEKNLALDIWIDPAMYKKSMEKIIKSEFNCNENTEINYINNIENDLTGQIEYDYKNMLSFEYTSLQYNARFYIVPKRKILEYHNEIIQTIIKSMSGSLEKIIKINKLTEMASTDPLTQCYNRREFSIRLRSQIENTRRYGNVFSIFMLDIDFFKRVNDIYGHQAGDDVLKAISKIIQESIRIGDTLARYGGEEFIVMLPGTDKIKTMELADRLREKIEKTVIKSGQHKINVTASFGVASYKKDTTEISIIGEADTLLYKAKKNGRNVVMPGLIKLLQQQHVAHS